jgi:hypothetical protein
MADTSTFNRPRYVPGDYLTAASLALGQTWLLSRLGRHNRRMHSYGVVCGMLAVPSGDPAHPWGVSVCPGYAIGPYGDEIEIAEKTPLDIRDFMWTASAQGSRRWLRRSRPVIAVRFRERPDGLVPVPGAPCSCEEPVYAESRIGDGFELAAVWTLPRAPAEADLCKGAAADCPPCPDSPWLPLATVRLPSAQGSAITAAMIDNGIRRTLTGE